MSQCRDKVFSSLSSTGWLDLTRTQWIKSLGYLEHRAKMTMWALIEQAKPKHNIGEVDKIWLQAWVYGHADLMNYDGTFSS